MPLPPALAAKLAKRGLISAEDIVVESAADEEVFAENYDDNKVPHRRQTTVSDDQKIIQEDIQRRIKGHPGCPNKYNIYHECTNYCVETYGRGKENADANYLLRKAAMLLQFPLPEGWQEVYDPGTSRCYFWNTDTDLVSWLPPAHPKHVPSEPACVLREEVKLAESDEDEEGSGSEEEDNDEEEEKVATSERRTQQYASSYAKGRNKKRENDLDPMDPASYSEIPRGTWASGLVAEKTGVDSTASGALFQQRPLPSPGAILRANQKKK